MSRFPYQPEPLHGPLPPSLPPGTTVRWRPLAPVAMLGPTALVRRFSRALLDSGADDTSFPLDTVTRLNVPLISDMGQRVRWRGQVYSLRFGPVELELSDGQSTWRWRAVVGFSPAPISYPILGTGGYLQFMDARFLGADLVVELETNRLYSGTRT
jgi:hypothetical protein